MPCVCSLGKFLIEWNLSLLSIFHGQTWKITAVKIIYNWQFYNLLERMSRSKFSQRVMISISQFIITQVLLKCHYPIQENALLPFEGNITHRSSPFAVQCIPLIFTWLFSEFRPSKQSMSHFCLCQVSLPAGLHVGPTSYFFALVCIYLQCKKLIHQGSSYVLGKMRRC